MEFRYLIHRPKFILFLFFVILFSNLPLHFLRGEFGLIEISQVLIILNVIVLGFKQKKIICKNINRYIYWIKQILLLILCYEELSFFTTNYFPFLDLINKQNELNLHNANFWEHIIFNFYIFPNDSINISIGLLISMLAPLIWGFGSSLKYLNGLRYLFLEKYYSFFCLIYPIYIAISYLSRNIFLGSSEYILNQESLELVLYIILLFDLKEKIKFYKMNYKVQKL